MMDPTIWRTPTRGCPACEARRLHDANETRTYHPYSGHGFDRSQWSHPALDPDHLKKWAAAKAGGGAAAMQAQVATAGQTPGGAVMDTGDFRYANTAKDLGNAGTAPNYQRELGMTNAAFPLHIVANSQVRSVLYVTNDVIRIESKQPMPSRWVCFWHRVLLGWRWEKPL